MSATREVRAGARAAPAGMAAAAGTPADWLRLLRPRQWVKNTFVLAPLLFSGRVTEPPAIIAALTGFVLFSLLASGVYCWNDVADRERDRAHPVKRNRPVAAGRIGPAWALAAGALLSVGAVAMGAAFAPTLGLVLAAYLLLNLVYTRWLKSIVLLDVFAIAAFFVLRLLAGVAAIHVQPSVWLLLCGGLLSLYLGFAKRGHELLLMGEESAGHRSVLSDYSTPLLDQMSGILLSVTLVSYIMYTLTSETAAQVGSEALSYSTVFVLYGVFRYLYLTHQSRGGDPAETLLTDRPLLLTVGLWLAYCAWILYRPL